MLNSAILNFVILSGVAASRSEAAAQSKDPYLLRALTAQFDEQILSFHPFVSCQGSFDSTIPFASERNGCA